MFQLVILSASLAEAVVVKAQLKLLPRLYEPSEGRILIDGYDISSCNSDLSAVK